MRHKSLSEKGRPKKENSFVANRLSKVLKQWKEAGRDHQIQALADRLNVSRQQVHRYKTGENKMPEEMIKNLCVELQKDGLNIDEAYFYPTDEENELI